MSGWTPQRVGECLIEAFKTDRHLPLGGPRKVRSANLPVDDEHLTLLNMVSEIAITSDEAREFLEAELKTRQDDGYPTSDDIARMNLMFALLEGVARINMNAFVSARLWAKCKSGGGSIREECKKSSLSPRTVRDRKDKAFSLMSSMLYDEKVPVF